MLVSHMITENLREKRGTEIARQPNQVSRIDETSYQVKSQNGNGIYEVLNTSLGWMCQCADYIYRGIKCKHIWAVEISKKLREKIGESRVIQPITTQNCISCGSENIVKNALRHNTHGDIQRYLCKTCGKRFSINLGFEKKRATPQIITSAMQLYFTGESLRNVQKFLKLQGITISHTSIMRWIRHYVVLMNKYLEKIQPNVSETWRADELYVKIKGDMKYLFALMDDETRFWIAQEVAETKEKHDTRQLFIQARRLMHKQPKNFITDGLPSFEESARRMFPNANHIQHIRMQGDLNNNKMERMNGEVRDREKVMRGLKNVDTPILKGYQIFHNYIRGHEGLKGRTPSEACGIKIEGKNKWLTLIQNASQKGRKELVA
jgi:transposase-like protein